MAAIDLTSKGNFSETKQSVVASAILNKDHFIVDKDSTGTEWVTLFRLPENCVVTAIRVSVEAINSLTNLEFLSSDYVDVLTTANPVVAHNKGQIGIVSKGVYSSTTGLPFDTGSGKKISVRATAKITTGKMAVIVEYIEYTVKTGSFTTYTPGT